MRGSEITILIENKAFTALLLFLFSFCVFTPSLKGDFVWDDVEYIQKTPFSLEASQILNKMFPITENARGVSHIRPVMYASFVIDKEIWGVIPFGFHLSNVIFYSVSTVLFYLFALFVLRELKIKKAEMTAFLSSLFFAVYPAHAESVSFIGARSDMLCSIFFFSAFIFHIFSYRRLWYLAPALLCFSLALYSKEVAVVFPLAVVGFDLIRRRFVIRGNILRYGVYLALFIAYFYLRGKSGSIIPGVVSASVGESADNVFQIWTALQTLLNSCFFYVKKLVFPFDTNPFIPAVPKGLHYLVASIFVMSLLCVISFVSIRKRENFTAFSIFWIFVTLAPSCYAAVFPVAVMPLAERFLYIPSAGYCMLLGYFIIRASEATKSQKLAWAFSAIIVIAYFFAVLHGQRIWKDNVSLWEEASKEAPLYSFTHMNYGTALLAVGQADRAIRELSFAFSPQAIGNRQIKAYAANNLGILYLDYKGDPENSERSFRRAISYDPKFYRAYYHLGVLYYMKGKSENSISAYSEAETYLKKALEIYPPFGRASLFLAKISLERGEIEKAKEYANEALRKGLIPPLDKQAEDILRIGD